MIASLAAGAASWSSGGWLRSSREGEGGDDGGYAEAERPGEGMPECRRPGLGFRGMLEDEGEQDGAEHSAEVLDDAVGAARWRYLLTC